MKKIHQIPLDSQELAAIVEAVKIARETLRTPDPDHDQKQLAKDLSRIARKLDLLTEI